MAGWINLATTFPRHPKALAAGPAARHLFIVGLCWAGEYDTDGAIPGYVLNSLAIDAGIAADDVGQTADRLVWVDLAAHAPGANGFRQGLLLQVCVRLFAAWAQGTDQTLSQHTNDCGADQVRRHTQVGQTGDGRGGIVGVQGGKHHMPRLRGFNGDVCSF